MNNLNNILIEGNLTKDPELKKTPKGTPVCSLSVASNRYITGTPGEAKSKEVSFFDVEVWAKQAEVCKEYLAKGRGVRIRGHLKQDRWQDGEGKWQSKVKIVGEDIEFKPQFSGKDGTTPELVTSGPPASVALPAF